MIKLLKVADYKSASNAIEHMDKFNYMSPYACKSQLSDMLIKRSIFNYEKVFIEKDSDIKNMITFNVCKYPNAVNRLYIEIITNLEDPELSNFIESAVKEIKLKYKKKNGISIYIEQKEKSTNLVNILDKLGFVQEMILMNELGEGNNVLLLTKYI